MNLLRSICCIFAGPCAGEEPKPRTRGRSDADLGQKEAELEEASEEELRRQCHGNSDSSAVRRRLASSDETDIV